MSFFKKKKIAQEPKEEPKKVVNRQEVMENITRSIEELKSVVGKKRIELLNKIGSLYLEINEIDKSIEYYEASITEDKSLGKAYIDLTKLYNIKRKDAIAEKDSAKIQLYLNKTDELMQLSKDTIRGRI